jgi:hypothetical protein
MVSYQVVTRPWEYRMVQHPDYCSVYDH